MRRLLYAAIPLIAACATPHRVAVTPYERVQYRCQRDVADSHYAAIAAALLYRQCMRAHGWSK